VAPLLGGPEIAGVTRFEPADRVRENRLEFGRRGCRNATPIAPNVDSEITANISQWPVCSGPSTLPASIAPNRVSAATPATSNTSRVRALPPSLGRDISTSTANHATPGMVTR
jgi:hypothetical protein